MKLITVPKGNETIRCVTNRCRYTVNHSTKASDSAAIGLSYGFVAFGCYYRLPGDISGAKSLLIVDPDIF